MTNKFNFDLQKIYDFITFQRDETNKLYKYLENNEFGKLNIIDNFAKHLDLELNNDLRVALISRLVSLKSDSFIPLSDPLLEITKKTTNKEICLKINQ